MMKMGLLQAPIPCATHAEGKGGLRHGPFDAGSTLVVLFKMLSLLALTSRLKRQMLRFGMERQTSSFGGAPSTSLPSTTRRTILAIKRDLQCRLAAGPLRRFPGPTLFAHGTEDDFLVPINLKVADIKGLDIMRLPALILTHGTHEVNLVLVLTRDELFARGVSSIDQMDPGEAALLLQRLVNRLNDSDSLIRGHRRFHMGDDMRGVIVTRLGQMYLVAAPVLTPLLAVPGVEVIGRGDHHGGGGTVFDVTPFHLVRLQVKLLHPDLAQRLDGGNRTEPGRSSILVNLGEQVMTIASNRFGQCLSFACALGLLVIREGFAVAEEPLRCDLGAESGRSYLRQGIQGSMEGLADNLAQ